MSGTLRPIVYNHDPDLSDVEKWRAEVEDHELNTEAEMDELHIIVTALLERELTDTPIKTPPQTHYHLESWRGPNMPGGPFITTNRHIARGRFEDLCENEDSPVTEIGAGFARFFNGTYIRWYECSTAECPHFQVSGRNKNTMSRSDENLKPTGKPTALEMVMSDLDSVLSMNLGRTWTGGDSLQLGYDRTVGLAVYLKQLASKQPDESAIISAYIMLRRTCVQMRQALFDRDGR